MSKPEKIKTKKDRHREIHKISRLSRTGAIGKRKRAAKDYGRHHGHKDAE